MVFLVDCRNNQNSYIVIDHRVKHFNNKANFFFPPYESYNCDDLRLPSSSNSIVQPSFIMNKHWDKDHCQNGDFQFGLPLDTRKKIWPKNQSPLTSYCSLLHCNLKWFFSLKLCQIKFKCTECRKMLQCLM